MTSFSNEYIMKSKGVSLKPPLNAFVRGVLMARVITTSSEFFCVLKTPVSNNARSDNQGCPYMAESPLVLGLRWFKMEVSLSVAISKL